MLLTNLVLTLLTCVAYIKCNINTIDIIDYDQFSKNNFEILSNHKFYILAVCKFLK